MRDEFSRIPYRWRVRLALAHLVDGFSLLIYRDTKLTLSTSMQLAYWRMRKRKAPTETTTSDRRATDG